MKLKYTLLVLCEKKKFLNVTFIFLFITIRYRKIKDVILTKIKMQSLFIFTRYIYFIGT